MELFNVLQTRFPGLERPLLEEMLEKGELRTIAAGETILQSGQNIRYAMLILEGLVKIYREDDEGHEFFMYYLDEGKACALSLLCMMRQQISEIKAQAVKETTLLAVPLDVADEWMMKYQSWSKFALTSYRQRFEELMQTIDHIAFRKMDERLIYYLKKLHETTGSNKFQVSFTQIAQDLNSSREVISRLMKKLSEHGLVEVNRNVIEIIDLEKEMA